MRRRCYRCLPVYYGLSIDANVPSNIVFFSLNTSIFVLLPSFGVRLIDGMRSLQIFAWKGCAYPKRVL